MKWIVVSGDSFTVSATEPVNAVGTVYPAENTPVLTAAADEVCVQETSYSVENGVAKLLNSLRKKTLAEVRTAKWDEIKVVRETAQYAPLAFENMVFDFDPKSQSAMSGAIQAAQASMLMQQSMPAIEWTLADNTVTTLTATQLMGILFAGIVRTGEIYAKARLLRDDIYTATTVVAVNLIGW